MAFPKRLTEKAHRGRVELPRPEPDVFELVPPTRDTLHLDRVWRLDERSSPLLRLMLWEPTDEGDKEVRRFLLDFGRQVLAAERRSPNV